MKAILFDRFGGTEVLREADIEVPRPGPGQVRVRVKAAFQRPRLSRSAKPGMCGGSSSSPSSDHALLAFRHALPASPITPVHRPRKDHSC
ncbi:hypothetical protein B6E66_33985 [Streptomyces maremycinicus]|nr:hypothetical protein B6E66_33985 [Streptomyces sp. B9173]